MSNTLTIAGRELRAYFASPIAYVVMAFVMVGLSYFFTLRLFQTAEANLRGTFDDTWFFLLLVAPIIAMRLIAEEKRQGTLELLLTAPVRDGEVVAGKFLAAVALVACTVAFTLVLLGVLVLTATPKVKIAGLSIASLDYGAILASYVGEILIAAAFLSVGVFFSSITSNQIVAAVVTLVVLIMLVVVSSYATTLNGWPGDALQYLSFTNHLTSFTSGEVNSKDVVFFLSVIGLGLVFAQQALGARRSR
jgi:ABC-2 type transport system permease protein